MAYCTERLDAKTTRLALAQALHQAKRNKAFENSRFIGLALDGTGAGRTYKQPCPLCIPSRTPKARGTVRCIIFVLISVAGVGLTLPVDVEPYGPGDSEYAAAQRSLRRTVEHLEPRFADYLVGDGAYATAPFLHTTEEVGLPVVARLEEPHAVFQEGDDRVEVWDADDFGPWETLDWLTVRVLRYRQHKPNGIVVQTEWLTNFSVRHLGSLSFYRMAKSRWEIENRGVNDGKNCYGMEHVCHHQPNSVSDRMAAHRTCHGLERLYRLRYLHRGEHRVRPARQLCDFLWLTG